MVKVEGIKDFDLEQIFECGQCFRWNREDDGSYTGVAFGKIVNMRMEKANPSVAFGDSSPLGEPRSLVVDNCSTEEFEQIWRPYLDLDRDYSLVKRALKGEEIARAVAVGSGIRILRQDFWEALVSFIISQNNNIPRIKGCIEKLAAGFGEKIGSYRGKDYYALPEPEVMACLTDEDLAPVRLGYRAAYLVETARQVVEMGGADAARKYVLGADIGLPLSQPSADSSPLGEPRNNGIITRLRTFQGVGPKVAACTALFGLGQLDAFPIDVWVRRVMHQVYGFDERDAAGMQAFARENFGEYGGIAQQYLFYYIRETSGK